jgi:hypothetical protein
LDFWADVCKVRRTDATVYSADVREGGPPDVRFANRTGRLRGTTGRTLLFEYPLDNTWTYETAIEPLGKNHRTYAPWLDIRYFSGPINRALPPSYFSQFQNAPRLPECFQAL